MKTDGIYFVFILNFMLHFFGAHPVYRTTQPGLWLRRTTSRIPHGTQSVKVHTKGHLKQKIQKVVMHIAFLFENIFNYLVVFKKDHM